MSIDAFTVNLKATFGIVDDWLTSYITQPHEQAGRPGAICPFVAPARRAGALKVAMRFVGPQASLPLVVGIVRRGMDEFERADWGSANPVLRSLLLVFPDLRPEAFGLLDEAHALVKSECVERGLMVGQFHPHCTEPAVRNPAFLVSKAPIPLVAIRFMAVHDIFFLGGRADWFAEYHRRFGARHRRQSGGIDPMLTALYHKALALHGIAELADGSLEEGPAE